MTLAGLGTLGVGFLAGFVFGTLVWVWVIIFVFYSPPKKLNHRAYEGRSYSFDEEIRQYVRQRREGVTSDRRDD